MAYSSAGAFLEGRGLLLARAIRHLADRGVVTQILHDTSRTAALEQRLITERAEFDFQLLNDLGRPQPFPLRIERDLTNGKALILIEARPARGRLPLHFLLLRLRDDQIQIIGASGSRRKSYLLCKETRQTLELAGRLWGRRICRRALSAQRNCCDTRELDQRFLKPARLGCILS